MAKSKKDKEIEAAAKAELEKQAQEATAAQEGTQAPAETQEAPQDTQDAETPAAGQEGAQGEQDGQEAQQGTEEATQAQDAQEGDEDKEAQESAQGAEEDKAGAKIKRKAAQGNVLVIYNGFVNLRRSPSMSENNISGQAGRGTVLNALAEVEADGFKWYECVGEVYIRADEALVEFMRSK